MSWTSSSLQHQQEKILQGTGIDLSLALNDEDVFTKAAAKFLSQFEAWDRSQIVKSLGENTQGYRLLDDAIQHTSEAPNTRNLVWPGVLAVLMSAQFSAGARDLALHLMNSINSLIYASALRDLHTPNLHTYGDSINEIYDELIDFCIVSVQVFQQNQYDDSDPGPELRRELGRRKSRMRDILNEITKLEASRSRGGSTASRDIDHDVVASSPESGRRPSIRGKHERSIRYILPPKSTQFLHREKELKDIEHALRINSKKQNNLTQCVIHGIGGIGKTEIALEYAYRQVQNQDDFDAIFWIEADKEAQRVPSYTKIGKKLDVIAQDKIGVAEDIDTVRETLESSNLRWLLIFDNVNNYNDVTVFVPSFAENHGAILFTTQKALLGPHVRTMLIEPFSPVDGADIILNQIKDGVNSQLSEKERRTYAESISQSYGGFPLVLAMSGGYIKEGDLTLEELWKELQERPGEWPDRGEDSIYRYSPKKPDECFEVALNLLPETASSLIRILAFLSPDGVPEEFFQNHTQRESLTFLGAGDRKFFNRMASDLRSRNLVKRQTPSSGKPYFQIHRYLQYQVLKRISKGDRRKELDVAFNQAFIIIRQITPNASPVQIPTPELWLEFEKVLPHLISLQKQAETFEINGFVEYARLLSDVGMNMWERGMTAEGLRLLEAAEKVLDLDPEKEELLRASINVIIVLLIWEHGIKRRKESRERIEKARDIRQNFFQTTPVSEYTRSDDILLHNAWSDYAVTLLQFHDVKTAEPIFERCLTKYQKWGGENEYPYEYAKYYHHKAFCALYYREFDKAMDFARKGWKFMQKATAKHSSLAYRFQFDLACIMFQAQKTDEALQYHETVLKARLAHGRFSFLTLHSYYAIGSIMAYLGKFKEAERHFRDALEGAQKSTWPDVAVARTRVHLAEVLRAQDQPNNDEEIFRLSQAAENTIDSLTSLDPLSQLPGNERLALADHMQPVFDARFAGYKLLPFVAQIRESPSAIPSQQ